MAAQNNSHLEEVYMCKFQWEDRYNQTCFAMVALSENEYSGLYNGVDVDIGPYGRMTKATLREDKQTSLTPEIIAFINDATDGTNPISDAMTTRALAFLTSEKGSDQPIENHLFVDFQGSKDDCERIYKALRKYATLYDNESKDNSSENMLFTPDKLIIIAFNYGPDNKNSMAVNASDFTQMTGKQIYDNVLTMILDFGGIKSAIQRYSDRIDTDDEFTEPFKPIIKKYGKYL